MVKEHVGFRIRELFSFFLYFHYLNLHAIRDTRIDLKVDFLFTLEKKIEFSINVKWYFTSFKKIFHFL